MCIRGSKGAHDSRQHLSDRITLGQSLSDLLAKETIIPYYGTSNIMMQCAGARSPVQAYLWSRDVVVVESL